MYSLLKGEPLMDDDATADAQDEQARRVSSRAKALRRRRTARRVAG
ncbi:hypothetical protein HET67_07850 [Streptomyces sp. McG7]|nr:hypothetical protein [Streptomyces sp. McG7]